MKCFNIRLSIGNLFYRLFLLITPSLHEVYQNFGLRLFFNKEMSKSFPWKKYVNKKSSYFQKWGFDVSMLDAEYYGQISGVKSDLYVTRSMAMHYIYPYLDRYDFLPAYMDKNFQKRSLDIASAKQFIDIEATEDIITNSNGIFFDGNEIEITKESALQKLLEYGEDMILKPSVDTYGGKGVKKVKAGMSEQDIRELLEQYHYNYTFQKVVSQHPDLAAFNPTSVNTLRVVTYRNPRKERKVLYSCLRFGGEGTVTDNVCGGGGYTGVNLDGTLTDRKRYGYFTMESPSLSPSLPNVIPSWDKIVEAALFLHGRLPHFDIIGWDFTVTPDGHPVLIEYNIRPGVGLQQAVGPMFSKEELDEIMENVSQYKIERKPLGVIKYKVLPGRKTVHSKFKG